MDGKSTGHRELPAHTQLGELEEESSKAELAAGQLHRVEVEQSGRNRILVREMPVEVSR